MIKRTTNSAKLGAFVLGGLLFLVLLLYMIGKNRNIFGGNYILKARFENLQGLVVGNNVRFSGIQSGTVKKIKIVSDTVIEVTMSMDDKMLGVIRKNAIASIGTEGLVGNKVVNIVPSRINADLADEGDVLVSKRMLNTDDILQTLNNTNNDVAVIAANLKITVARVNNSSSLWALLNDKTIPEDVKTSIANIRLATNKAGNMVNNMDDIIAGIKRGEGSLGAILTDTLFADGLNKAVEKIRSVGERADSLAASLNFMTASIQNDLSNGKGTIHALLKDSSIVMKLNKSLDNIQNGTDAFNQDMEALKHNFLLRGYFRKQEKKKKK